MFNDNRVNHIEVITVSEEGLHVVHLDHLISVHCCASDLSLSVLNQS